MALGGLPRVGPGPGPGGAGEWRHVAQPETRRGTGKEDSGRRAWGWALPVVAPHPGLGAQRGPVTAPGHQSAPGGAFGCWVPPKLCVGSREGAGAVSPRLPASGDDP